MGVAKEGQINADTASTYYSVGRGCTTIPPNNFSAVRYHKPRGKFGTTRWCFPETLSNKGFADAFSFRGDKGVRGAVPRHILRQNRADIGDGGRERESESIFGTGIDTSSVPRTQNSETRHDRMCVVLAAGILGADPNTESVV